MSWKTVFVFMLFVVPVHAQEKEVAPDDYKKLSEEAVKRVKELQHGLYQSDRFIVIGRKWYDSLLEEVRELRRENTATKKQLQSARDYLENLPKPIYVSDITGKIYDETESPLYREKIARRIAEEKLKKEREDRSLDNAVSEAKISELNSNLYVVTQERDKLQKQVDEARRYFQTLKDKGIVQ